MKAKSRYPVTKCYCKTHQSQEWSAHIMASILILYKNRKLCKYTYMVKRKSCIWSKILLYLWWNDVHLSHCAQNQYSHFESDFTQPILVRTTARVIMRIIFWAYFSYLRIFAHILIWHKLACQICQSLCIWRQDYSSLIFPERVR